METDPKKRFMIDYKSIILDIVEKYKTYRTIETSMEIEPHQEEGTEDKSQAKQQEERKKRVHLDYSEIQKLPEGLLYKFRKCRID